MILLYYILIGFSVSGLMYEIDENENSREEVKNNIWLILIFWPIILAIVVGLGIAKALKNLGV